LAKTKVDFKKIIKIVLIGLLLGFIWMAIRGPEDRWMCVDGEWVKHGVPSAPKPTKPCS